MAKRRKPKRQRLVYPSPGPLPARLAERFADRLLVFSDASRRIRGGLAAVFFASHEDEPLILTRSVAPAGSNELELQAAVFALQQAREHFPERLPALFSDNRDTVTRLQRALELGLSRDEELARLLGADALPAGTLVTWIRSHATCRGNLLADQHAALAAG